MLEIFKHIQGGLLGLLGPHKVAPGPQKRQKWPFLACLGPQVPLFGGLRGPNWPLWMCLIMSSFVQIELLGVPMAKNGHFRPKMAVLDLLGHPVPLFGGPKGPNKPPWMCYTMSNHVQPMSNPFGSVGGVYGQKWPFWTPTNNQTFHDITLFWRKSFFDPLDQINPPWYTSTESCASQLSARTPTLEFFRTGRSSEFC